MGMRTKFDEQLKKLNASLEEMGEIVEEAINNATKALVNKDTVLAKQTVAFDDEIDEKEKDIEKLCLRIILQQQPVAGDLRHLSSILKITTDLERIGDHAADISEITLLLATSEYNIKELKHIEQMAEETMKMLKKSIEAFVKKDLNLAQGVIADDDKVDGLFITVKKELTEFIKQNTGNTDQAMDFMMIAKYFERIGDHATNIAEWVVFSLTGKHKDRRIM